LSHLDESYRIDQSIGANAGIADDQLYRGTTLAQLGRYQEARDALNQAASIAKEPGADFKEVQAWLLLTDSRMSLAEQRFAEAKTKGQQALELAGTEVKDLVIQAKYTVGLAQAFSGSLQPGRKLCEEALALAKEGNSPRLISNALLAVAEVLLRANDAAGALANAMQAKAMFERSGQQDSEWRAYLVAARASQLAGDTAAMNEYASRADSLCAGLQQKWGPDAYSSYLQRKDIQGYRNALAQILSVSK
jgi:tetratricopeptide (TPR) repeat protein